MGHRSIDIAIVGGGIAGLAAVWESMQRGRHAVVFEKGPRVGGVILTETIGGFVIDAGPDGLLTHKPAAIELCRELGLGDRLVPTLLPRQAFVLRGGRLVPLPEASVLGIPTRVAPFVGTRLFSWPAKFRMGLELFVPPRRDTSDESIGSFIRRRFGQEAVSYLAEPLLAGIHAGHADRLSMRALFPRLLEAERTRGSVLRSLASARPPDASRSAFLSLPGGVGEFAERLASRLPEHAVRCGTAVATIEGTGPFQITTAAGEAFEARTVVLAAPAWAVATMVAGLDRELSDLVSRIQYASSATVAFGLRREQVGNPLEGSGFVVPRTEGRSLMAATWVSSKWPNRAPHGCVLLRGFLGGASNPEILERSDRELERIAFADLASILDISGEPMMTRLYRWPRATAQHEVGHLELMERIDRRLAELPGVFVTGSGFRGTGIPDCISDGRATAAKAVAFLG